ncbi:hypothetical protein Rumal_0928 [Ruminococcus albus 7 = DSM 20455]|uniref:Uncharacterized protein n=1 Tax=Ruminococcus albus (strain ATCC 27210 / DSM 20455 / JCM 14654 / NCDO 2250 / 7) TaxID=697329 RepID=E6UBA4_RUMA7|nr:hypothetical protein Rumal_0928 [Ruminococcus albus 7 = DSM 20455]
MTKIRKIFESSPKNREARGRRICSTGAYVDADGRHDAHWDRIYGDRHR